MCEDHGRDPLRTETGKLHCQGEYVYATAVIAEVVRNVLERPGFEAIACVHIDFVVKLVYFEQIHLQVQ